MNKLAYIALGILVERFHDHLTHPQHITSGWYSLSAIWNKTEHLFQPASFEEMQAALDALVEANLIEKRDTFLYCFRVTRIEFPKSA